MESLNKGLEDFTPTGCAHNIADNLGGAADSGTNRTRRPATAANVLGAKPIPCPASAAVMRLVASTAVTRRFAPGSF
jgi:hypothetical protein